MGERRMSDLFWLGIILIGLNIFVREDKSKKKDKES
jgi:hypothetical protein